MDKQLEYRGKEDFKMLNNRTQKLVGIFLLSLSLFNFPIIHIFGKNVMIWGIPLLFFYTFAVWLIIIITIIWVVEFRKK